MRPFLIYILISTCICTSNGYGQNTESVSEVDTTINLLQELTTQCELILFENEQIIIKSSYELFEKNMEEWLKMHPHIKSDKELLKLVKSKSDTSSINVIELALQNKLDDRLEYRMTDLIDKGQCIIYSKEKKSLIPNLTRLTYSYVCGPTCGHGGRIYSIDGVEFFRVLDWIS